MEPITLKVQNVHKRFDTDAHLVEVLRGVSFQMSGGESLAITGPSGSGKSTLLHLIGTLDRPSSGQVLIRGKDPHQLTEPELATFRNRSIGFVFQDHHLLMQYSVLENVLIHRPRKSSRSRRSPARRSPPRTGAFSDRST